MSEYRKKLIEVALPLAAINAASAREKSIRHGHPSTLHLWWARRPLATARAVIFAQMVDDPSAHPDRFPTEEDQERERQRLFRIIEDLVLWDNTTNEDVFQRARDEIWKSWRSTCADSADHARAKELFDPERLPAFHDPFAGGGALPLAAQRLGLESHASDLNPVAVLINKAMIEIPPRFCGNPPVNPDAQAQNVFMGAVWGGAQGLAEDVRYYGKWMRDVAEERIGHLYPSITVTEEMAKNRSDLEPYAGQDLTVIAWIWARTVKSPNPAFADVEVPLVSTYMLSTKKGREAHIEPVTQGKGYRFVVKTGTPTDLAAAKRGTRAGKAQDFLCLLSGEPIPRSYIRDEGKAGRLGKRLFAIVAKGERGRVYLSPRAEHATPEDTASGEPSVHEARSSCLSGTTPTRAMITGGVCSAYGLSTWGHLFSARQLVALTTFSDLVQEARDGILRDALAAGLPDDDRPLADGGSGARAYAEAVGMYLSFAVSKATDRNTTLCVWENRMDRLRGTFGRQAIPMVWDYVETNPLAGAGGDIYGTAHSLSEVLDKLPAARTQGQSSQLDAATLTSPSRRVVSTDPPYYDNIGYADLSDFFYVWLRRSLKPVFPELFATLAVPKAQELVATPYRHGGKEQAEAFFLTGMTHAMHRIAEEAHPAFPVTIYYAFKQSETKGDAGVSSTGWETFLDAVIRSGFALSGTWPMRTELGNRMIGAGTNALASSVVLVCRRRDTDAPVATRREFATALKTELPDALTYLQRANIAPVDLAQAAIGPGMSIYTRYSKVIDADGNPIPVRDALAAINQTLDEILAEQEGDFDADSRWAVTWFAESGFEEGDYGVAETLSKAKNTSVPGLVEAGILSSKGGKVRLFRPSELPEDWDPATDTRCTVWEKVHHLIRLLDAVGEAAAADLVGRLGSSAEAARELAYRLYVLCERKKRAEEARAYNGLVVVWPELERLAGDAAKSHAETQEGLFNEE